MIQGCPRILSTNKTLTLLLGVSSKIAQMDLRFKFGLLDSPDWRV